MIFLTRNATSSNLGAVDPVLSSSWPECREALNISVFVQLQQVR